MNSNQGNTSQSHSNRANIIQHDSSMRGYSVENSFYDSPFNMDFEYGYLNMMFNITAFTARTQDMFQSLESNLSSIIELQNERRRLESESRQTRETRENNQNSNIRRPSTQTNYQPSTQPVQNNSSNILNTDIGTGTGTDTGTGTGTDTDTGTGLTDNLNYLLGRRNIFDSSNNVVFSFLPRSVLLNPTTLSENILGNTSRTSRRNRNGLTIQEIEENTEIISYGSITTRQGLNTECPISRDSFNDSSIVLRVKECGHCYVPFRMITWLESQSTCPLCRRNIIVSAPAPAPAPAPAVAPSSTNTFSNIINNIRNSTNLDNLSIDNMNDDSIVFSFDLPRSTSDTRGQSQGQDFTNTYLSSLSEIFSNLTRNNTQPSDAETPNSLEQPSSQYDEVD